MSNINVITIENIKYLAHFLAKKTMNWDEPIPEFETRYKNSLESCVATPFQKFDKRFLYRGLIGKASVLFYLMIKNHPFQNGNKRIAVATLLVFLYINKKWISVDNKVLYNTAKWIAQSPVEAKDDVISYIEKFIKKNLIAINI